VIETLVLPSNTPQLVSSLLHFIDDPSGWRLNQEADALSLLRIVALIAGGFLAPPIAIILFLGIAGHVGQNAPRFVLDRIMPDLSRVSPMKGLSRMFSMRGLTEFGKSLAKLAAVGGVVALILSAQRAMLLSSMFADAADLPERLIWLCTRATAAVAICVLVLAGADLTWTRIHWRRDLRMSRYEIKEEMRQAEGDRAMKARFRSLRLSRIRKAMMKAVPRATMVVVNPTHYAVAMRYVRSEGGAPLVLAKGVDLIALKIREIAMENNIPIIEDKPLARSLYDAVAVDAAIPPEFYRAVAEIVHMIQEKRASWSSSRRRVN
jgi:flagellar biosynthetic protein FlhB